MKTFVKLEKLKEGDTVSVISPSSGAAGMFPWVYEQGLDRLKNQFKLLPKEYPTTRQVGASLQDRAKDIMAAFSDPETKAVISTIGGIDQVQLLKYLDPNELKSNPKPFFGFSDNTHLVTYLWNLGIPAHYGGAIMTQYAFHQAIPEFTEKYLRKALFEDGEIELKAAAEFNEVGLNWADKENLKKTREFAPNAGWQWDGSGQASGILWGGCLESMVAQLGAAKFLPKDEDLDRAVLFLETSEEMPEPWVVMYVLIGFGERGWLDKFQAVLMGRPKAWEFDKQLEPDQRKAFRDAQAKTVVETIRKYNQTVPIVQNLDFGHTDPQFPVSSGKSVRIDADSNKIWMEF